MKRLYFLLASSPILALSGCVSSGSQVDPLRAIAASVVSARAFDEAQVALRRDDDAKLKSAGEELRRAADAGSNRELTNAFTVLLTAEAGRLSSEASASSGADKVLLLSQSDEKYRVALAFAPDKLPEKVLDANTLNGLGYFLADRGQSRQDFERAAVLTRAAYKSWPMGRNVAGVDPRVARALFPQDSYAWSLFKLKRYEEAKVQQEEVLKIARQLAPSLISVDLPFHMAEIYRALRDRDAARREYDQALQMKPDAELKAKIMAGIAALDFKEV